MTVPITAEGVALAVCPIPYLLGKAGDRTDAPGAGTLCTKIKVCAHASHAIVNKASSRGGENDLGEPAHSPRRRTIKPIPDLDIKNRACTIAHERAVARIVVIDCDSEDAMRARVASIGLAADGTDSIVRTE